MDNEFNDLSHDLENLENNLITVINDLKASTEIILKELTGYLNVSAHDLSEIRTTVIKVETVLDTLKEYINRLDDIEKELSTIKPAITASETNIMEKITTGFNGNSSNMKKVGSYLVGLKKQMEEKDVQNDKRLDKIEGQLRGVTKAFNDTKEELVKSQEGLYNIINNLVSNQSDVEKAQISLQGSKIKTDADKQKQKLLFWAKIIGILFGSGGILFFVIKSILESLI